MDGFSSQAWLSSTQTNGESLNELDLHMILISFPALKASINCLEKINRGGIDAARALKRCPHAADSLPIEREKHNTLRTQWLPLFTSVILIHGRLFWMPAHVWLTACSHLSLSSRLHGWLERKGLRQPTDVAEYFADTKMFDLTDSDYFSSIDLTVQAWKRTPLAQGN